MNHIADDVSFGQATIFNVATGKLPFWHGVNYQPYDLGHSYDFSAQTVGMGEEWDHIENGFNPYGFHSIGAHTAWQAVQASPTHEIVF